MANIRKLLLLGLITPALVALFAGERSIAQPQKTLPKQELLIMNAVGAKYCFDVELAILPSERAKV